MQSELPEKEWLKVGTSWNSQMLQKSEPDVIEIKDKKIKKKKKKDEDRSNIQKNKKKDKKQKDKQDQIVVQMTQQELDLYYDKIIEDKKKIDPKAGFIYRHELAPDLLTIQVIKFGNKEIYMYGHREKEVPQYRRIDHNILLGLPSDLSTQTFLEELAVPIVQRYSFSKPQIKVARYTQLEYDNTNFPIKPIQGFNKQDEFIQFNKRLQQGDEIEYKILQEQKIIKEAKDLQSKINENSDNLSSWKRFLFLQEKIAEIQGYNEETIIASRRLAILEKLEQASEILADHPWVLAYKIFTIQNLQHKDEDFERQISSLWDVLFQKYIHIQPIWILYLDHKLKSESFNGTAFRIAAVQSIQNLKQLIDEAKRPQTINYYKKIYLELIKQINFYENEMGYRERAFGIYQSLCELNIFDPLCHQRSADSETKMMEFQNYWEEYSFFKTGEFVQYSGWKDHYTGVLQVDENEFIGQFSTNYLKTEAKQQETGNTFKLYLQLQKQSLKRWRPSNTRLEQDYLSVNVDSLVLYEDIENYLTIFNDKETKLLIVSGMLEQLGFPSLLGPLLSNFNNYYMAQVCFNLITQQIKSQLKSKGSRESIDLTNIFVNDLLIRFQPLLSYFAHKITAQKIEKFIYVRRLLAHLITIEGSETVLSYYIVIEGILYQNSEKLEQFYPQGSLQRQEILQAPQRIKNILRQFGDQNQILCTEKVIKLPIQLEQNKTQIEKIFTQIFSFAKSKKKKLQILYFLNQFHLNQQDYENVIKTIKKIVTLLLNDDQEMSMNLMIIKIRGEYMIQKNLNKLNNPKKIENQKLKSNSLFNLSKKAILQSFILLLDFIQLGQITQFPNQQDIENHIHEIEMEYNYVKGMFFQDPVTKNAILEKYQNEMLLNLLNFFRYVKYCSLPLGPKEQILIRISSSAMQHEPNSLIFYIELLNLLQSKGVYFLKFDFVKKQMQQFMGDNFFQSAQVAWMILIVLRQSDQHESDLIFKNKLGYLHDFLLQQSKKSVTQIYCESNDQETFEAVVSIMYNYYLEKILLTISRFIVNQEQLVRLIYQAVKKYPFSIVYHKSIELQDLYNTLLKESNEDQQESLKILNVIEEKELKTFQKFQ